MEKRNVDKNLYKRERCINFLATATLRNPGPQLGLGEQGCLALNDARRKLYRNKIWSSERRFGSLLSNIYIYIYINIYTYIYTYIHIYIYIYIYI